MNTFLRLACLGILVFTGSRGMADDLGESTKDELLSIARRKPLCLTIKEGGLPRRVIITRSGAGLFAEVGDEKPVRPLAVFSRLYLFAENNDGFHRVGPSPFTIDGTGWVSKDYCLLWDHNEMLFLDERSVPEETDRIYMWGSLEDAKLGNPDKAIYSERIHRDEALGDVMFPVVERDELRQFYKVAFVFGGDEGGLDEKGGQLSRAERHQIARRISEVNIAIVIDATGSMRPWIQEAKSKATAIVDAIEKDTLLKDFDGKQLDIDVRFGLVAYRDRGDEFEVKTFVPLTKDRVAIKRGIAGLQAGGGGDFPEQVVPAIRTCLKEAGFHRGSLNRIVLVGDAPPHILDSEQLSTLGGEARAQFVQVDALVCGNAETVEEPFSSIAKASGGTVRPLSDAKSLASQLVDEIRGRLRAAPIETRVVKDMVEKNKTYRQAARDLGLGEYSARQMRKLLVARGADVGRSGTDFDHAWVRVGSGREGRLRVLAYTPTWELGETIASMMSAVSKLETGSEREENAEALVLSFLKSQAGAMSAAGLKKSGDSAKTRATTLPVITPGVLRGEKGALLDLTRHKTKIRGLLKIFRNRDSMYWEDDHIWVPVDLLP